MIDRMILHTRLQSFLPIATVRIHTGMLLSTYFSGNTYINVAGSWYQLRLPSTFTEGAAEVETVPKNPSNTRPYPNTGDIPIAQESVYMQYTCDVYPQVFMRTIKL